MIARCAVGALMVAALAVAPGSAQTPAGDPVARELEAIRDQVVALNIESALAGINNLLERPGLTDAQRVSALDLKAQAHAASDNLTAVEKDFRAILEIDASYAPDKAVTSKKAMARFATIQAATVGTIQLALDPKDAALTVDDRPVAISAAGAFKAIAGERRLHFTHTGFDALDSTVRAVAGQETLLKIQLVPNARTLVVRTDVDGVAVTIDGTPAGLSARVAGAAAGPDAPAELLIENAAIGEHEIRLTKSCFAAETLHEMVSADLTDRTPKALTLVVMRPARTRVAATGATYDGELRVDGVHAGSLPLTTFSMCPGQRKVEALASGRTVWSGEVEAEEADLALDLAPRPNAALVGTHWPASWAATQAGWSDGGRLTIPPGADLTTAEGWHAVALPSGTDLALGVIPSPGVVGDERVVLYSPLLQEVEERPSPPASPRPSWRRGTIGAAFADDSSGAVVVATVAPSGPAVKSGLTPGDRVVSFAARPLASAAALNDAIEKAGAGSTIALEIASPGAAPRKVECTATAGPRPLAARDDASRVLRAAWASVDVAAGGSDGPLALAGLATLLEQAGRDAAAFDAWQRIRQSGADTLAPRAAYAVGAGLQAQGKRAEAIEAFTQARSEASARSDVALAAAAGDRLADLGVAPH